MSSLRKSVGPTVCLFVTYAWNCGLCENGNAIKHCNFENDCYAFVWSKVSSGASTYSSFSMHPGFPFWNDT